MKQISQLSPDFLVWAIYKKYKLDNEVETTTVEAHAVHFFGINDDNHGCFIDYDYMGEFEDPRVASNFMEFRFGVAPKTALLNGQIVSVEVYNPQSGDATAILNAMTAPHSS